MVTPPRHRRGLSWLWVALGVTVLATAAVTAWLLRDRLSGTQPERGAIVLVEPGPCDPGTGTTPINVLIDPAAAAAVTVSGGDGFAQTFTGPGGASPVGPGEYSWTAHPAEGFSLTADTRGSLAIPPCRGAETDLTAQEQQLQTHIPATIRDTCRQEQRLGRAGFSLMCEHRETTLFYDQFPNNAEMETYYDSRVREFGISPGTEFCDVAERAENAYARTRGDEQPELGRLVCSRVGGKAVFIWTDRRVNIAVEAQRGDRNNERLFGLWARAEFGPVI